MLNADDKALIAAAVAEAEARTSGEVLCALTEEVSTYREVPVAWAGAAALVLPLVAMVAGLSLEPLARPFVGWSAGHGTPDAPLFEIYAVLQVVVFAVVAVVVGGFPAVRRRLTPRALKQRRVRRAATLHFAGARAYLPPGRPAVLLFASLADRQMEIVADPTIDAAVGAGVWDKVVAEALGVIREKGPAAGLARAVKLCGDAMARHYPDDAGPNRYPDAVVEL